MKFSRWQKRNSMKSKNEEYNGKHVFSFKNGLKNGLKIYQWNFSKLISG